MKHKKLKALRDQMRRDFSPDAYFRYNFLLRKYQLTKLDIFNKNIGKGYCFSDLMSIKNLRRCTKHPNKNWR